MGNSVNDWNAVVESLGPTLLRYFQVSFPQALAEDLVQEVLIRLVRKVEAGLYDEQKGSLKVYAFGLAHFVRLEAFKKARRLEVVGNDWDLDARIEGEGSCVERDLMHRELRGAVARLSEKEKEVVLLYLDRDLTLREIASILGYPVNTVKSHLHRAKKHLKKFLSEQGETHERYGTRPNTFSASKPLHS